MKNPPVICECCLVTLLDGRVTRICNECFHALRAINGYLYCTAHNSKRMDSPSSRSPG
jgi:hypothetical protein